MSFGSLNVRQPPAIRQSHLLAKRMAILARARSAGFFTPAPASRDFRNPQNYVGHGRRLLAGGPTLGSTLN